MWQRRVWDVTWDGMYLRFDEYLTEMCLRCDWKVSKMSDVTDMLVWCYFEITELWLRFAIYMTDWGVNEIWIWCEWYMKFVGMEIFLRCDSDMSEKRPNYDLDVTIICLKFDWHVTDIWQRCDWDASEIWLWSDLDLTLMGLIRGGPYLFVDCRFGHYLGCRL